MNKNYEYEREKQKYLRRLYSGEITYQEYERLIRELCRRLRY